MKKTMIDDFETARKIITPRNLYLKHFYLEETKYAAPKKEAPKKKRWSWKERQLKSKHHGKSNCHSILFYCSLLCVYFCFYGILMIINSNSNY